MPNSVEKTMIILRAVSDLKGQPASLELLSNVTKINKSTLAHIVLTLCKNGYLQRISHSEGYIIGPELHFLTRYGRFGESIISVCHPILEYLNRETGSTAVFAVLGSDKKYIIDRAASDGIYNDSKASILNDDLYRTVTGRVLLANCSPDRAMEIYNTLGAPEDNLWKEAVTVDGFLSQLKIIGNSPCYYLKSVSGKYFWHSFALPIYNQKKCEGALGLAIKKEHTLQNENTDTEKYISLMLKCKKEIERRLRFS